MEKDIKYYENKILEELSRKDKKHNRNNNVICLCKNDSDFEAQRSLLLTGNQITRLFSTADFIFFCLEEKTDFPVLISTK